MKSSILPFFRSIEIVDTDEAIDLTDDMREAMILAFPTVPVCRPECKGLCPQCGINRNKSECECSGPVADSRWQALDKLEELKEKE